MMPVYWGGGGHFEESGRQATVYTNLHLSIDKTLPVSLLFPLCLFSCTSFTLFN